MKSSTAVSTIWVCLSLKFQNIQKTNKTLQKKTENPKTCQNIPKNPETSKTFFQKIQKKSGEKKQNLK